MRWNTKALECQVYFLKLQSLIFLIVVKFTVSITIKSGLAAFPFSLAFIGDPTTLINIEINMVIKKSPNKDLFMS